MNELAVKIIWYVLVFSGVALMVYNIFLYFLFIKYVTKIKNLQSKKFFLYFPFVLLILFLVGYLLVGIMSDPDLIMSGILFGGSVYVFLLLIVIRGIVNRILENDKLLQLRYDDMRSSIVRLTQDANFVLYVNLSEDKIIERTGKYLADEAPDSYSGFLMQIRDFLIERIHSEHESQFTRESLLKSFEEGHHHQSEIILIRRGDSPTFVKLEAELAKQPETGNIMAFISEHDYNEEMVNEVIIDNVLEEQFDLVAYIRDHTYQIVVKNPTAKNLPALDSGDFNDYLDEIIGPMVEDREILKALSPETVLCELATHKEHEAVVVLNGEEVSYKEFSFYLIDENSKFFLLLIKDITKEHQEQAQLNDRLHHALAESKRATEAKSLFFSNMSHDIRTPMNAIVGFVELSKATDDIRLIKKYLDQVESSSQHLLALINDILVMSRIESGKMELVTVDTDLNDVGKDIYNIFHLQMEKKGLAFSVSVEAEHPYVSCDKNRLNRVLTNLTNNAYKFTKSGSVSVTIRETGIQGDFAHFEIRVKDTGVGMAPEFAERIYNAFERERISDVENIQGSGLGMAIAKSIVTLMGGSIALETELGKGSEFIISVSFELLHHAYRRLAKEKADYSKFEGIRVLLAEDNEINREIAKLILAQHRIEVVEAHNGAEAYELLDDRFAMLLTDIQMPVMNGYELARKIRAESDRKDLPIIAMTADAFQEDIDRAMEAGMNEVVTKPIDQDKLFAAMLSVLK